MKTIERKALYKKLKNDNLDYVAYVITQWHVHSLEAALKMLEQKECRKLSGIIIIKPHPINGYLLNQNCFTNRSATYYHEVNNVNLLDDLYNEFRGLLYYLFLKNNNCENFYYLRPTSFRYTTLENIDNAFKNLRKVVFVKLDEGVGTYLNTPETWLKVELSENNSMISKVKSFVKFFEERFFDEKKLQNIGRYIDACLLKKINGICYTNEKLVHYYKESISKFAINKGSVSIGDNKDYIIINTQLPNSMFRSGQYSSDRILGQCIKIFSSNGYNIFLKAHPRDKNINHYKKLGVKIIYESLSQEVILALVTKKPKFIVGFFSTTLITSSVLFGVKTISLDDIVVGNDEFLDNQLSTVSAFKQVFNEHVVFCKNFNDLKNIILK